MRVLRVLIFSVLLLRGFFACAQSLNYIQYTTRDGIAGSTVYDLCQDKEGFIWFATNNGLTRFDGRSFKTYSVKDGLPDNEILKLHPDSMGRLWIASFRNEICYYEKGKIYNKHIKEELNYNPSYGRVLDIKELRKGLIWIITAKNLLSYKYGDSVRPRFTDQLNAERAYTQVGAGPPWFGQKFSVIFNDSLFYISDTGLVFYRRYITYPGEPFVSGIPGRNNDTPGIVLKNEIIMTTSLNQQPYFISTINGAVEIDTITYRPVNEFLPGKVVTKSIKDREGIYWFSTLADGVFKLPNKDVKTLKPFNEDISPNEVFAIASEGNRIFTGNFSGRMNEWDVNYQLKTHSFNSLLPLADNRLATNRLNVIYPLSDGSFLLGFDAFLIHWQGKVKEILPLSAIKSIAYDDNEHVIVGTGLGMFRVDIKSIKVTEVIWEKRTTTAVRLNNRYYVGTLEGLIELNLYGEKVNNPILHPSLKRRIIDLKIHDNALWVATSDSGILQVKNRKVVRTFTEDNGLNSNICRVIYPQDSLIWIGTDRGLCKYNYLDPDAFPVNYDSYNLLPSNIVNAVYINNGLIYIGSPVGLTYFREEVLKTVSKCTMIIQGIKTEQGTIPGIDSVNLTYGNNLLEMEFVAVSVKSAGGISYFFRMKGLDDKWNSTKNEKLTYTAIPPGNYFFEIYAVNQFGVKSSTVVIPVFVSNPFWKQPLFVFGEVVLVLSIIGLIFFISEKVLRKRFESKNRVIRQKAELEQLALQAQMNPHFIFNSLNSIQQYILASNSETANRFLTIFSRLIMETIENSSFQRITLSREIDFLTKYLELEKMRFGEKFRFEIVVDESIDAELIKLPVMLLQPYVENALRHGIRYRSDNEGMVKLNFEVNDGVLICRIWDNGVGRAFSAAIKSESHIEYQSKGMNLTQRRVDILNSAMDENIELMVKDLLDASGKPCGTEVIIRMQLHLAN